MNILTRAKGKSAPRKCPKPQWTYSPRLFFNVPPSPYDVKENRVSPKHKCSWFLLCLLVPTDTTNLTSKENVLHLRSPFVQAWEYHGPGVSYFERTRGKGFIGAVLGDLPHNGMDPRWPGYLFLSLTHLLSSRINIFWAGPKRNWLLAHTPARGPHWSSWRKA